MNERRDICTASLARHANVLADLSIIPRFDGMVQILLSRVLTPRFKSCCRPPVAGQLPGIGISK
jgi:hypothetical protein